MNKYLLATSAFSNPDLLDKCVRSWPDWIKKFVLFDRTNPGSSPLWDLVYGWKYPDIEYVVYSDHAGCSAAWNFIMQYGFLVEECDSVIIVGSDIEFKDNFLEEWIEQFESGGYDFATTKDQGFNCFGVTKHCFDTVGFFDENFFPAYFEDNDYWVRVAKSGLSIGDIGDPNKFYHYGSATIRRNENCHRANSVTYSWNQNYFWRKWGAHQDSNLKKFYDTPFNSGNPISWWEIDREVLDEKKRVWSQC